MPSLPTIADVFRITIEWNSMNGVRPVNVFHVRGLDAGDGAGDVLNTVIDHLEDHTDAFSVLTSGSTIQRVLCLPLDGSTAAAEGTTDAEFGSGGNQVIPAVAGILSIRTGQRGPRGRGRMYIGPVSEDLVENGTFTGTVAASMSTAWNDLQDDWSNDVDTSITLGVASYVHADFHDEVSLVVEQVLGTQRRRQDQLR